MTPRQSQSRQFLVSCVFCFEVEGPEVITGMLSVSSTPIQSVSNPVSAIPPNSALIGCFPITTGHSLRSALVYYPLLCFVATKRTGDGARSALYFGWRANADLKDYPSRVNTVTLLRRLFCSQHGQYVHQDAIAPLCPLLKSHPTRNPTQLATTKPSKVTHQVAPLM